MPYKLQSNFESLKRSQQITGPAHKTEAISVVT